MKSSLLFDFSVNRENKTIHLKREFNGNLELVWKAWTTAELLDQWWAPKPYRNRTKTLDFREGGTWLYYMISPKDEIHWCKADYIKIEFQKLVSWLDAFCDEHGNDNSGKPRSLWTNIFSEDNGITTVNVTLQHNTWEDVETLISMGLKEGFSMALQNLDELLSDLKR